MKRPRDPRFVRLFVNGLHDRLFAYYAGWSEEDWARLPADPSVTLHRNGTRGHWAVTIRPISNRMGQVVKSNFINPGTTVRSATPLRHAGRRLGATSFDTIGDPRRLVILAPPRAQVVACPMTGGSVRRAA